MPKQPKEIEFDPELLKRLVGEQFKVVHKGNWLTSFITWMTDSKYRTYKRLDKYLKEQFDKVTQEMYLMAMSLRKRTPDETIIAILKWVSENIKYVTDKKQYGYVEKWGDVAETFSKKEADCENQNTLIYILARFAGIPSYVMYCAIGDTSSGGHFWLTYYSTRYRKLVAIDSTFYPNFTKMKYRTKFKLDNRYQSIWYIFNEKNIFKP